MKTFKEYSSNPVVSFDFDDTIFMTQWDNKNNDLVRDDEGNPIGTLNKDIAKKIKEYKNKGYTVYVITTRFEKWRPETEKFLQDNDLMNYIDEVIFTNNAWKANTCKKYGVKIHYDDYPEELRRLKYKKIKGVRVKNESD